MEPGADAAAFSSSTRKGDALLPLGLLSTAPASILLRSLTQGILAVAGSTVFLTGSVLFGVIWVATTLSASRASAVDPAKTLEQE